MPLMAMSTRRQAMVAGGLLVLAAAWLGPLPAWSRHSFAAHMLMHMAVVALAAPLLALGVAGTRMDPSRRWPVLLATGAAPVIASVVEFVVVWAWHAPALHQAARASAAALVLEQGSFLAVGLALWVAAFGSDAAHRRARAGAGIGGLLLTSMHMTLLGVLLALATRPLYVHGLHAGDAARMLPLALTPLEDQHLGGVLMLVFGGSAYLAGALWLLAGLLRERAGTVTDG